MLRRIGLYTHNKSSSVVQWWNIWFQGGEVVTVCACWNVQPNIFKLIASTIRVNLLHPQPSLFLYGLLLSFWCLCILVNNYFHGKNLVTKRPFNKQRCRGEVLMTVRRLGAKLFRAVCQALSHFNDNNYIHWRHVQPMRFGCFRKLASIIIY